MLSQRVRVACTRCKRDKVRCSDSRPCPRCIRLGVEDECIDAPRQTRRTRRRTTLSQEPYMAGASRAQFSNWSSPFPFGAYFPPPYVSQPPSNIEAVPLFQVLPQRGVLDYDDDNSAGKGVSIDLEFEKKSSRRGGEDGYDEESSESLRIRLTGKDLVDCIRLVGDMAHSGGHFGSSAAMGMEKVAARRMRTHADVMKRFISEYASPPKRLPMLNWQIQVMGEMASGMKNAGLLLPDDARAVECENRSLKSIISQWINPGLARKFEREYVEDGVYRDNKAFVVIRSNFREVGDTIVESCSVNEAIRTMMGYECSEWRDAVLSHSDVLFVHHEDFKHVLDIFVRNIVNEKELFHTRFRGLHKDGEYVPLNATCSIRYGDDRLPMRELIVFLQRSDLFEL